MSDFYLDIMDKYYGNRRILLDGENYEEEITFIKKNILTILEHDNYYLYQKLEPAEAKELYLILLSHKDFIGFKIEKIDNYRYVNNKYIYDVLIKISW